MNKYFILLVGESGSGKTTVADLLEDFYGYKILQSYTTRAPRQPGEWGHTFVTDEEFDKLTDFVGYTNYNGHRYCATAQQVEENDVYVIDPAGVDFFAEAYKGDKEPIVFFLDVSKRKRKKRMLMRGDSKEAVKERLRHDKKMFKAFRRKNPINAYPTTFWIPAGKLNPFECMERINEIFAILNEREGDLT